MDAIFLPHRRVRLGQTRLRTILRMPPPRRAIFVVDAEKREIYVEAAARETARESLGAVERSGGAEWIVALRGTACECRVRPMAEIGDGLVAAHHLVGIEKSKCVYVREGRCVEVEDEDGNFSFSFKAPKDFHGCSVGEEVCKETAQTLELEIYSQKNCQGAAKKSTETILFCTPV